MTKQEAIRYNHLINALDQHGINTDGADTLLKAERALRRWSERECNGVVERDEDTGVPYASNTNTGKHRLYKVRDMEASALRAVERVIAAAPGLTYYHQSDPRGCALYIIRPGDVLDGRNVDEYYTRGIAICI